MTLIQRVVARHIQAEKLGEPKLLLEQLESELQQRSIPQNKIDHAKQVIQERVNLLESSYEERRPEDKAAEDLSYTALFAVERNKLADIGHKLFLSILQSYELPPALRKKIEIASRTYMKQTRPRLKMHGLQRYLEHFALYEEYFAQVRAHLEIARQAVAQGKGHTEGSTKLAVGLFTLVNTGGFSESVMQEVTGVAQKAQALLKGAGLGKVCYGEIQITNTVGKSSVAAFYLPTDDGLFVRANIKDSTDTLKTVLHELGHRYHYKFLASKKREIEQLYRNIGHQEVMQSVELQKPEPGEVVTEKGKSYRVTGTRWGRSGLQVALERVDNPKSTAQVSLEGYHRLKGNERAVTPDLKGYVSEYAKRGGPEENFAEMFAFYCLKKLPTAQVELFETLVFGG